MNCPNCGTPLDTSSPVTPQPAFHNPQLRDPDEINLLEYVYALVKNKWWIVGAAIGGLALGYVAALIKGPTWTAKAVIAPKESDKQAPQISALGGLGGMVASQLGLGGNASLEKIDVVLESRKFNAEMIGKYGLTPLLVRTVDPDSYRQFYDTATGTWTGEYEVPSPEKLAGTLKGEFLEKEIDKSNTLTMEVNSPDSAFSDTVLSAYVEHLNAYLKDLIAGDARENVTYLENKLVGITDPLLREKLQGLIASEIEKAMVVSKEAFEIIDPVFIAKGFREKKLYPLVFGFGLGFLSVLFVVFGHALGSGEKTEEDRRLLEGIRREMSFSPFRK